MARRSESDTCRSCGWFHSNVKIIFVVLHEIVMPQLEQGIARVGLERFFACHAWNGYGRDPPQTQPP
jgi:hypothetical protein